MVNCFQCRLQHLRVNFLGCFLKKKLLLLNTAVSQMQKEEKGRELQNKLVKLHTEVQR